MPAPSTIDEFLDLVRKSGVVEEKRVDAHVEKLRANGTLPNEPGKLAGVLVRDGILTHFQAEQFLLGKWRRFQIGKYKVLERLGSGGMGSVYLCEHKFMRRRTAVKVLPTAKAEDPASLERFYREARAVAALDHPNIVRAYDIDQDEKLHFLVMEYVDGSSLQDIVKKHGPMEVGRAAHYIRQAAVGLQHAHQTAGLVHRDIKPGNLLVDRNGVVKILDMGLARFFHDQEDILTKKYDEAILGTADYLSPEQAIDSHNVDIRADLYSLGATFYFLLTAHTPFNEGTVAQKLIWHQTRQPKPVRSLRPEVPGGLAAVLEKMMSKDPAQRYQSPAEVVAALAPWAPQSVPPPPKHEMPRLSPAAMGAYAAAAEPGNAWVGPTGSAAATAPGAGPVTPPTPISPSPAPKIRPGSSGSQGPPARPSPNATVAAPLAAPAPAAATAEERPSTIEATSILPAPEEESPPWERLIPDTDDAVARVETVPQLVRKPTSSSRAVLSKRGVRIAAAAGALVTAALVALAYCLLRNQDRPVEANRRTTLTVSKTGDSFRTVAEALKQAEPGDRIMVLDERIQEQLILEDGKFGRQVTIEAAAPGKRVLWLCPPNSRRFVALRHVEGLRLKGFVFDGQNYVDNLIAISGKCPGFVLEDVQLQGFKRCAVLMASCTGNPGDSGAVSLIGVRAATAKPVDCAFKLGARDIATEHVVLSDCRLEGPYQAAIRITGPVSDVSLKRNRFFQAADGIFNEQKTPPYRLRLTVEGNTFCDVQCALHVTAMPDEKSQVVVKGNLFARTAKLLHADAPPGTNAVGKIFSPSPAGNVRDPHSQQGSISLTAEALPFELPTSPVSDAEFLRYPKDSALNKAGPGGTPVGVPPD